MCHSRSPAIEDLLHPLGAAGPIAVEYVHLLALEDEGAETVLRDTHNVSSLPPGRSRKRINLDRYGMGGLTRPTDTFSNAFTVMVGRVLT